MLRSRIPVFIKVIRIGVDLTALVIVVFAILIRNGCKQIRQIRTGLLRDFRFLRPLDRSCADLVMGGCSFDFGCFLTPVRLIHWPFQFIHRAPPIAQESKRLRRKPFAAFYI